MEKTRSNSTGNQMIFSKSIINVFRSKWKSVLFISLIFVLTIVLSLGLSVWASVSKFLEDCDDNYKTIALFEYMGTEYPDEDIYDEDLQEAAENFDYSLIENNENVILFDKSERALGYVEGFVRTDRMMPRKDSAVFVINRIRSTYSTFKSSSYSADIVESIYYCYSDVSRYTRISPLYYDFTDNYESGHYYLVNGEIGYGSKMYSYLTPKPFSWGAADKAGFPDGDKYMVQDITTEDGGYEVDDESPISLITQTYSVTNNSVNVYAVDDLTSNYIFHQQEAYIKEGREFTQEEYDAGSKVCIVSELFKRKMDIEVGDIIPISIVVTEGVSVYESYWAGTGFTYEDEYEIVGIINSNIDFNNNVYIPKRDDISFAANHVGYTLGQAVLINSKADEFYNDMLPMLPERVEMTIYDQGYAAVAKPFMDILRIAKIITVVCIMVSLAVIIFFAFLFVYRQRDVSDVMIKLGTGKKKAIWYFIFSTGFIAVISAGLASIASYKLSSYVIEFVRNIAANYALSDTRYSNGSLTIVKEMVFNVKIEYLFFLIISACVVLTALICSFAFTLSTFKKKAKKKKKKRKMHAGHTFSFRGRSIKYSIISIIRGGIRTMVVPMLSFVVVLFFFQLSSTAQSYEDKLSEIKQDTVITGIFTDIKGQKASNVIVESYQLKDLIESGYINNIYVSKTDYFDYVGRSVVDGEPTGLEQFFPPELYAYDTWVDSVKRGPRLIYANSIKNSPQFFFSSEVNMEFLDGYDESILGKEVDGTPCCIVSTDYMKEYGIELGDTIRLFMLNLFLKDKDAELDYLVVGSYVKEGLKDNIYCQLEQYIDLDNLYNYQGRDNSALFYYTFDSANFTIEDAAKLDEFKAFLSDYGFSSGSKINTYRNFLVLNDKKFISTVDMLNQQIRYINVLYPILYALVGIIALVVSYLLAVSRRKEFAIMRGLGAPKRVTFMSFFAEQAFLCIIGTMLGIIAGYFIFSGFSLIQIVLVSGFVICYMIGCLISILIMNNTNALAILKYED
ncbi:MAG: ABC transporter permease [Clostridia bacterium]|nr:ABC transporter permease [Clostridia bacterium]